MLQAACSEEAMERGQHPWPARSPKLSSGVGAAAGALSSTSAADECSYPECRKLRFLDERGFQHDFCGRTHAFKAAEVEVILEIFMCRKANLLGLTRILLSTLWTDWRERSSNRASREGQPRMARTPGRRTLHAISAHTHTRQVCQRGAPISVLLAASGSEASSHRCAPGAQPRCGVLALQRVQDGSRGARHRGRGGTPFSWHNHVSCLLICGKF